MGSNAAVFCWRIILVAIYAPCLTKSTESLTIGSRRVKASALQDPAQEIPTARVAPYLTWGLKLPASKLTIFGTYR